MFNENDKKFRNRKLSGIRSVDDAPNCTVNQIELIRLGFYLRKIRQKRKSNSRYRCQLMVCRVMPSRRWLHFFRNAFRRWILSSEVTLVAGQLSLHTIYDATRVHSDACNGHFYWISHSNSPVSRSTKQLECLKCKNKRSINSVEVAADVNRKKRNH